MTSPHALIDRVVQKRHGDALASLSLGTMNFGTRTNEPDSRSLLARAIELGFVHFDTANAYGNGVSETIVGSALRHVRDKVVIATKVGFGRVEGKPEGLSKTRIHEAANASLRRLGTEWIDIYYLHVPDHRTPIDESLDAIAELLESKKIRAWGVSNYGAWQIMEMMQKADARTMQRPKIAQQLYNVLVRQLDIEYFAFSKYTGLATTVYNPLAGGILSGKHARDGSTQAGSRFDKNRLYQGRYFTETMFDRVDQLKALADENTMSLTALSYGWLASQPSVDSILLGPATLEQLNQSVAACGKRLPPNVLTQIDNLHRTWLGTDTYYVR